MKVVVNASPIIFLSKLNALDLLVDLFPEVLIPRAVVKEVGGIPVPEKAHVLDVSLPGRKFVLGALGRLHEGELEVIVLALERSADLVLLDDLAARRKAKRMGLQVMGTVGLILTAFRNQKVAREQSLEFLEDLTKKHGFFISKDVLGKVKGEIRK